MLRGLLATVAVAAVLSVSACMPPTGAELVEQFTEQVQRIDGVTGAALTSGPIEVQLEPDLDRAATIATVSSVLELLGEDAYARWQGDSVRVGTVDAAFRTEGAWIYWSGGPSGELADVVETWFLLREARQDPYLEYWMSGIPGQPAFLRYVPADAESSQTIEAQYLAAWARGPLAQQELLFDQQSRG